MHQSNRFLSILMLVVTAVAGGCQGVPAADAVDAIGPTTRERLGDRERFALAALEESGGSALNISVSGSLVQTPADVTLPVLGGHAVIRADDQGLLLLEDLEISLDDVIIDSEAFPPRGLHLTGLTIRLAQQVAAEGLWTDDEQSVAVSGELDALLDWAVVLRDGSIHPLATQRIHSLEFDVLVEREGATGLRVDLQSIGEGEAWHWGPYLTVSDVSMSLQGASASPL